MEQWKGEFKGDTDQSPATRTNTHRYVVHPFESYHTRDKVPFVLIRRNTLAIRPALFYSIPSRF